MYQVVRKLFFTDCQCAGDATSTLYEDLFARLDTNKDGKVDVAELKAGLAAMGVKTQKGAAQVGSTHGCGVTQLTLKLVVVWGDRKTVDINT